MKPPVLWINASIYTPSRHIPDGCLLVLPDGRIGYVGGREDVPGEGSTVMDAQGCMILPGFIDLHVHGGGGFDAMKGGDELLRMSRYHAQFGTTSMLATTLCDEEEAMLDALRSWREAAESEANGQSGAEIVGFHLEGPFLNPLRGGAQNRAWLRSPSRQELHALWEAAGSWLRMMTIAPELPGAEAIIRLLHAKNVIVSAGHTDATLEQMKQAVCWGVSHMTHHFNGMSPFHPREPGAIGAGLMLPELTLELIADGHHIHPDVIAYACAVKGREQIAWITDAVSCAGCPDGRYKIEGQYVRLDKGKITLEEGGGLAGSDLNMLKALRNAKFYTGLSLECILPGMTTVPARQLGLSQRKGSLEAGMDADFVVVDEDWQVRATIVKGRLVYGR